MTRRLLPLALAACALALPACSDAPDPETTRQALERLAPTRAAITVGPAPTPAAYKVIFDRVDAASKVDGDGHRTPRRLERTVRRPFTSGVEGELQRRLGFEQDAPGSVERAVLLRPLPDEPRPDVYPPDRSRDAQRGRTVAGRICRVYVFDDDEYCVDAAGLVLSSRRGETVDVAVEVTDLGNTLTPAEIAESLAKGVSSRDTGSVRPLDPSSTPPGRTDWALPTPPTGFTFVGRYAVVPLTGETLKEGSRTVIGGIVDVYVRGVDAIVVDRGGKLDTSAVDDKDLGALESTSEVELAALGRGLSGTGGIGPFGYREVRAFPEKGRYVVVAGTVPEAELVEVARALRPSPGTTLRYLDR